MKSSNPHIDFSNTEIAFHLKTDAELERAYFLFKMISNQPLVRIGAAATHFALKSKLPVEGLIRSTVFDHFCGVSMQLIARLKSTRCIAVEFTAF